MSKKRKTPRPVQNLPDIKEVNPRELWRIFQNDDESSKFTTTEIRNSKNPEYPFYLKVLELTQIMDEKSPFVERLFFLKTGMTKRPICTCCGGPVKFDQKTKKYGVTCSNECKMKVHNKRLGDARVGKTQDEILGVEKSRETTQKRSESMSKVEHTEEWNSKVQEKLEAWRAKNRELYGTSYTPEQLIGFKERNTQWGGMSPEERSIELRRRSLIAIEKYPNLHKEIGHRLHLRHVEDLTLRYKPVLTRIKNGTAISTDKKEAFEIYRRLVYLTTEKISWKTLRDHIENSHIERRKHGENPHDLDHIFSIFDGFQQEVPFWIIAHPINLRVIPQGENRTKEKKSHTTVSGLLNKIIHFEKKTNIFFLELLPTHLQELL